MVSAAAASSNLHANNIKNVARFIGYKSFQRLSVFEPFIRYLVPVLVIIFIYALGRGAIQQIKSSQLTAIRYSLTELEFSSSLVVTKLEQALNEKTDLNNDKILTLAQDYLSQLDAKKHYTVSMSVISILDSKADGMVGENNKIFNKQDMRFYNPFLEAKKNIKKLTVTKRLSDSNIMFNFTLDIHDEIRLWRENAVQTLTLYFSAIAVIILVSIAYIIQIVRTRNSDLICAKILERFETALSHGHSGLWDINLNEDKIYWSQSMYEILELDQNKGYMTFDELEFMINLEDLNFKSLIITLQNAKECYIDREFRLRSQGGDWIWIRLSAELIYDCQTQSKHLVGIAVNVTEKIIALENQRVADQRLKDAIDTISEAFVLWDKDKNLIMCNKKFKEFQEISGHEIPAGLNCKDISIKKSNTMLSHDQHISDDTHRNEFGYEAELKDGRWLKINEKRTKDGGYVSVGTDITQLKTFTAKLLESEARLKTTVSDLRQSQITLEKQAEKLSSLLKLNCQERLKAEAANKAKSLFLSNMSHEFRTPLNAIIGFSEIMQKQTLGKIGNEKYINYCTHIKESGQYLFGLVNDILQMSQIEEGKIKLNLRPVNVLSVCKRAIESKREEANQKQINIILEFNDSENIYADEPALIRIIKNILDNAVKFSEQNSEVLIKVESKESDVIIQISDKGCGMDTDSLRKIGAYFLQFESMLRNGMKGSGLGLAIAKALAELHGGYLEVTSKIGIGTDVKINLVNALIIQENIPDLLLS